jgi:hypothetical protein
MTMNRTDALQGVANHALIRARLSRFDADNKPYFMKQSQQT